MPLIVKGLSDKEMLQYMGRENGEDYASDFLVMLNTWEACINYYKNQQVAENREGPLSSFTPIEIARFLGLTMKNKGGKDGMSMSHTANKKIITASAPRPKPLATLIYCHYTKAKIYGFSNIVDSRWVYVPNPCFVGCRL